MGNSRRGVMADVSDAHEIYRRAFLRGLKPDPIHLDISEWADQHRFLSPKASAEPGLYRTSRTPYMREIMQELSPQSKAKEVVFMKSAQIGATEAGLNMLGYYIDLAPCPIMVVQPDIAAIKKLSKQRIAPLIENSPRLHSKIGDPKSRDGSNSMFIKEFEGGMMMISNAGSASALRSAPIRVLFMDEVDGYPPDVQGEGDPVNLARKRTSTFKRNMKVFQCSTPLYKGASRIEDAYEKSDQRRYYVPCPHCDHMQYLKFGGPDASYGLKWDEKKPETAKYVCEECGTLIDESKKTQMLADGEWRAKYPERKVAGFHLNALYSPLGWQSWADIAQEWINSRGNNELLQSFINTVLGQTWELRGEAPEWENIYRRRESYKKNTVPDGVVLITAGVDVQKDRLECELVGWGRNMQSWSLDYRVLKGDTTDIEGIWSEFSGILSETWVHPSGAPMKLRMCAIDSGYNTQAVYYFIRMMADDRLMAVKGKSGNSASIIGRPKRVDINYDGKSIRSGTKVWSVGVDLVKSEIYNFLRQQPDLENETFPHGYCHFPQYDKEYFRQLTAEKRVKRTRAGRPYYQWELGYERNEALDCRVYARAAAEVLGISRFTDDQWASLENDLEQYAEKAQNKNKSPRQNDGQDDYLGIDVDDWL